MIKATGNKLPSGEYEVKIILTDSAVEYIGTGRDFCKFIALRDATNNAVDAQQTGQPVPGKSSMRA